MRNILIGFFHFGWGRAPYIIKNHGYVAAVRTAILIGLQVFVGNGRWRHGAIRYLNCFEKPLGLWTEMVVYCNFIYIIFPQLLISKTKYCKNINKVPKNQSCIYRFKVPSLSMEQWTISSTVGCIWGYPRHFSEPSGLISRYNPIGLEQFIIDHSKTCYVGRWQVFTGCCLVGLKM